MEMADRRLGAVGRHAVSMIFLAVILLVLGGGMVVVCVGMAQSDYRGIWFWILQAATVAVLLASAVATYKFEKEWWLE